MNFAVFNSNTAISLNGDGRKKFFISLFQVTSFKDDDYAYLSQVLHHVVSVSPGSDEVFFAVEDLHPAADVMTHVTRCLEEETGSQFHHLRQRVVDHVDAIHRQRSFVLYTTVTSTPY